MSIHKGFPVNAGSRPLGEIFSMGMLNVPIYQRPFVWDIKHIQELWDDIKRVYLGKRPYHFFGAMIFHKQEERSYKVVDGHQRLLSITILLSVIRDYLILLGDKKDAQAIQNDYIAKYVIGKGEFPIFTPHDVDVSFCKQYIQSFNESMDHIKKRISYLDLIQKDKKRAKQSHKRIASAYMFFYNAIDEDILSGADVHKKIEKLIKLHNIVTNDFYILYVELPTEEDAQTVFETLNERGTQLNVNHMVNNYLIQLARRFNKKIEQQIVSIWRDIRSNIEQIEAERKAMRIEEQFDDFLRYYYAIKEEESISKRELYRYMREFFDKEIRNVNKLLEILNEMRQYSECYRSILSPRMKDWKDYQILNILYALSKLGKQYLYLILYVKYLNEIGRIEAKDLNDIIKDTHIMFLRFLCRGGNPNMLTSLFMKITKHLKGVFKSKGKLSYDDFIDALKNEKKRIAEVYGSDQEVRDKLLNMRFKGGKRRELAKALLYEIIRRDMQEKLELRTLSLEHIIPSAEKSVPDHIKEKLGNLTLMDLTRNQKLSSKSFKDKVKYYKRSAIPITKELAEKYEIDQWDPKNVSKTIKDRTEILVDKAMRVLVSDTISKILK